MKEKLRRLSLHILKKYLSYKEKDGTALLSGDKERKLSRLNPGKSGQDLITDYYTGKISYILLAVAAIVIVVILVLADRIGPGRIADTGMVPRHDYGGGDYTLNLNASTEDYDYGDIALGVNERKLKDDECLKLMDELYDKLLKDILADNESLDHIETDLYFPALVEGYPFSLRWESSDYLTVDSTGQVDSENTDGSGEPVDITVIMTYRNKEKRYDIKMVVYPVTLSGDDLIKKRLLDAIRKEDSVSETDRDYKLPDNIDGKKITWKEVREPIVPLIIMMGMCLIIGIWFGTDRDLKKKYEERNRQLIIEYAEFVSKLQILLSSGSTIRRALERMADDYRKNREKGGGKKYVYEELLLCIRKLGDGMSEAACYEYFGNRCGVVCYKKLSAMLIQNLRKGTEGLIAAMDNEVRIAFEERKAVARKLGEEAQTKLMLPMMLMLSVVMIIIMIPAYLSFGGM